MRARNTPSPLLLRLLLACAQRSRQQLAARERLFSLSISSSFFFAQLLLPDIPARLFKC
jgi:hypothetical protein